MLHINEVEPAEMNEEKRKCHAISMFLFEHLDRYCFFKCFEMSQDQNKKIKRQFTAVFYAKQ